MRLWTYVHSLNGSFEGNHVGEAAYLDYLLRYLQPIEQKIRRLSSQVLKVTVEVVFTPPSLVRHSAYCRNTQAGSADPGRGAGTGA